MAEERKLYETAIRHGIGSVTPEEIQQEVKRQGGLLKDGQVTTRAVLAEESRIIDFAREGKGTMRPLNLVGKLDSLQHFPKGLTPDGEANRPILPHRPRSRNKKAAPILRSGFVVSKMA